MKHKWLTALLCLFTALLVITGSIALPIYFRPFYYWQVEPLDIPKSTGYDRSTVIAAYDEVLDYLTIPGAAFGTGVFPHTAEGESHFADCKRLFTLNAAVLVVSLAAVMVLTVLRRRGAFRLWRPRGRHYTLWTGGSVLTVFAAVGALAALDFDRAFVVFHRLFFPGKDNWIFNIYADPIINALPEEFFLNCGLLILGSVVACSVFLIIYGLCSKSAEE